MAQRTVTTITDDLDGSDIGDGEGGTVAFSIDGKNYELDLLDANKARMLEDLKPYIEAARETGSRRRSKTSGAKRATGQAKEIRGWAAAAGFTVPARGRIPQQVREAYDAAH